MKDNAKQWHRHIEKQAISCHPIHTYWEQHQLSSWMFYYWKRKLKKHLVPNQFEEIQIVEHRSSVSTIHVRFLSGVEMWLAEMYNLLF